jgi:hypothetical protein
MTPEPQLVPMPTFCSAVFDVEGVHTAQPPLPVWPEAYSAPPT